MPSWVLRGLPMASLEALPILLKELRLSTIGKCWEALAQQALDGQWLPQQYLAALCEEEVNERYQQRLKRYLHEAQLPAGKRLSHFDFSAVHGIKANQVKALVEQPQWVKQAHNLLLFGPSGKDPSGVRHRRRLAGKGLPRQILQCHRSRPAIAAG